MLVWMLIVCAFLAGWAANDGNWTGVAACVIGMVGGVIVTGAEQEDGA